MKQDMKSKVLSGLTWKFGERILSQGISFVISLVLARMLMPSEYGTVSLVLVFINLANVFVSNGLGETLIQKKDASNVDFSTIFYCSLLVSIFLYTILFAIAPLVGDFYENQELILVLRILALRLPVTAINTIQQAYVSKKMDFKRFFFSTLGGTLFSGVIGIWMAFTGYGIWALVVQYLSNSVINTIVLTYTVKWKPQLCFSISSAKEMIPYGWKLTAAAFVNTLYGELRNLIIGRIYTTQDLAYYNKGNHFPSLTVTNIDTSISSVLFPALSLVNNDKNKLKEYTRKSMQVSSYIIFPMMIGMYAVADTMITVLLTENWIGCVPFLRLSCIYWMIQPIQTANAQAIKACGRSDIYLRLETTKKIIGVLLIILTMRISVLAVVSTNLIMAVISITINIFPNKKLLGYGYVEQLKDIFPALLLSMIMGVFVWGTHILFGNTVVSLLLQILVGLCVYLGISAITNNKTYKFILTILADKTKKANRGKN